jgi:hypothetical protein
MTAKPAITWVNHASYILKYESFSLITDPWLFGSAFNKGWDLYAPTTFQVQDFAAISHIWFSHEHPDHFSPPVLSAIPKDIREQITILFQKTKDGRIINHCANLGFNILELEDGKPYRIQDNIKLICKNHGVEDSFLFVDIEGTKILNLNDCVFLETREELRSIKNELGSVDCLLYQFGYAEKIGNSEDVNMRRSEAKKWLNELVYQSNFFEAKYIIPFASYKYFSHSENAYMNDCAGTPAMVLEVFKEQKPKAQPIILFPGDVWALGELWDNTSPVERYTKCWLSKQIIHSTVSSVSLEAIFDAGKKYCKQIRSNSNPVLLKLLTLLPGPASLSPIIFYVQDLNTCLSLNIYEGLKIVSTNKEQSDISIGSDSLYFFLGNSYGANTLIVNARYRYKSLVSNQKIHNFAHIGLMIGSKQRLDFAYISTHFRKIVLTLFNRLHLRFGKVFDA